ncbi:MAG TPA: hypothetical protein VFG64_13365 [Dongiaceae bacterium]|nr:hypothetical protein [Dongiaceae bacterium]
MVVHDWTRRLDANPEPVVRPMPKDRIGLKKGDLCLLPSARLVDDFVRAIPKGKAISLADMRATLAPTQGRRHLPCPSRLSPAHGGGGRLRGARRWCAFAQHHAGLAGA